ncbi:MAG: OOP family OmpA-OmpF porin [Flavobacteriales bacterium]|jgi:OOP family OmpA-OmpF porin
MKTAMKTLLSQSIAALSIATISVPALAEDRPASIFATTGKYIYDDDTNLEDTTPLTIGMGYDFTNRWTGEFSFTDIDTETETSGQDLKVKHLQFDGLYNLGSGDWRPYVVAGLGERRTKFNDSNKNKTTLVNAGLGLKGRISEHFQLRGDVRTYHDLEESSNDYGINLGVAYLFGSRSNTSKPIKTKRPISPANVQDSDMDGVADSADRCQNTPKDLKTDTYGCAIDSDKDGVADHLDNCPSTAETLKVDAKGCPLSLSETISIDLSIKFANNSDMVSDSFYSEIKDVADFMNQYANTSVVVEGYTDDRGKATYNETLSQRRADAVRAVLVNHFNVDASRVSAKGYGEINPIATNDTTEGRASNRRVVAKVSSEVTKKVTK